ncbi:UvrD-helicase-domain-containing protein [Aureobasidium pullulans]|uniref:DNA 3'-5' helicase n=1 Tax=Aureobasidium pullulans TaxID=5580 RepID=A0AB74INT3_AURPU|nr:UvrD-helicase-domain-containing protein [Aureobasidium pullulans]
MDKLLDGLNRAQRLAVTSPSLALQVLAPPGSGKTKTLTARVSYLITERGLQPWNIIVCTFTVKAAKEMKERIKGLVGDGLEKKLILGTFHSVARRFLVSYGNLIGIEKNFGIADMSDSKAIITRIIKRQGFSIEPGAAGARMSSLKAKSMSAEQYAITRKAAEQEFSAVYSEYEEALRTSNLLDYDDLLLRCAQLLREHPQCVSNIEAVLIDEFQDTNSVQFELMCLFSRFKKNITIVGDPDQSIYGWRNAEIKNLERMEKRFPGTDVIHLEENYRSAGAILQSAQKVIEQDESRPSKALKPTFGIGDRPVLRKLPTADAEAKWLVSEIRRTQALSADLLKFNDFAVLLRSAAVSRHIESALGNSGIPYRMVGGTKFFDRIEVKMILDYLRIINQPDHNDALLRVINIPTRGVGDVTVKGLIDEAERKRSSLWKIVLDSVQGKTRSDTKLSAQASKGLTDLVNLVLTGQKKLTGKDDQQASPFDLVEYLIKKLELSKYLQKRYPDDYETRWANVEELKAQTADLTAAMAQGEEFVEEEVLPEIEGLEQRLINANEDALTLFLANIALSSEVQRKQDENPDETQQHVTISTIHAAKGLEWPVVFIPACYEGSIPHSRADDIDEERRLLYVGMTRAQALLYLSCPNKNSQSGETTMSHFLTQRGIGAFFETQGPKLYDDAVNELARTLRRDKPDLKQLIEARSGYETPEDTHYPLDGTFPKSENARWDQGKNIDFKEGLYANKRRRTDDQSGGPMVPVAGFMPASKVTMQNPAGFSTASMSIPPKITTAASRMEELEAVQSEARLRDIDARKAAPAPIKRSKAAQGSANIMSFFGKPKVATDAAPHPATLTRTSSVPETQIVPKPPASMPRYVSNPLNDISNVSSRDPQRNAIPPTKPIRLPNFKLRTSPLTTKPTTTKRVEQDVTTAPSFSKPYTFLSSPPLPEPPSSPPDQEVIRPGGGGERIETFRPATTFHATSVTQVGNKIGTGRRLGMGRSFKPWSARGGRGG